MNQVDLLKQIIATDSYVDKKTNEALVVNYINKLVAKDFKGYKTYKQKVEGVRNNLIIYNNPEPKIVFFGHMDTVLPIGNANDRLVAKRKGDKLFGLGASDMKGGIAVALSALQENVGNIPCALVLTCDEEYYFKGIKTFINDYKNNKCPINKISKPEIIIFAEPTNLKIGYGCRGCVELEIEIGGKSAHAGRPLAGINAIECSVLMVSILKRRLIQSSSTSMGYTTVNLASMIGGVGVNGQISSRPNAIPDRAKIILDIRTANNNQDADYILDQIKNIAEIINVKILNTKINLDLLPFVANKNSLKIVEDAIGTSGLRTEYIEDFSNTGYGEFAMLGAELGWNAINLGPGPSDSAHKIDEYVSIKSLNGLKEIYLQLLNLLGKKL